MIEKMRNYVSKISLVEITLSLIILYAYLAGIEILAPAGINETFADRMQKGISYIAIIFLLSVGLSSFIFRNIKTYKLREMENKKLSDYLLILLPMSPIVQYILLNQDTLSLYGSFYLLSIAFVVSILVVISIPVLLSKIVSRVLVMSIGLSLIFLFFYMPSFALENAWHKVGNLKTQLLIFLLISTISFLIYKFNDKFLKILIVVFFISNLLMNIQAYFNKNTLIDIKENQNALKIIGNNKMITKPDIYLLTYDSYVANETMLGYGIDNSAQEKYLEEQGFKIYDGTYSVGQATWATMTRILNMSVSHPGRKSQVIAGKSNVHKILRSEGYSLGGVMRRASFWEGKKPLLNFSYPEHADDGHIIISKAIMEGEFNFDAPAKFSGTSKNDFIKMKRKFMSSSESPKFLYTHTGPNHSQNSGKCRANEIQLFEERLIKSNQEMKEDIETIQKNNPNALIIINGDHGPYLTGNCTVLKNFITKDKVSRLDVQDRYGAFLAIKWPKSLEVHDDITVIQDLFLSIFSTLMKDKSILDNNKVIPNTIGYEGTTAGVSVENGIIKGGVNDEEPLFLGRE